MYQFYKQLLCLIVITSVLKIGRFQTTGDVRLFRGDGQTTGIVQLYNNNTWYTMCGYEFDSAAADVVCSQLGFSSGEVLPKGAYGEYFEMEPYPQPFQGCSSGNEERLLDCSFSTSGVNKCTPHRLAYANVKCLYDTTPIPGSTVELDSTKVFPESGYLSPIRVYTHSTWGHVCAEFWDDIAASIVCRQLGFSGGVAAYTAADWTVPILVTDIKCSKQETQWEQCARNDTFCYNGVIGSVFCYQNLKQGPTFSLVGGKRHYGKVVLSVDGQSGLICNSSNHDNTQTTWTYKEAYAVCSSLGFNGGYVLDASFDSGDVTEIVLDGVKCDTGNEDSIFQCEHNGWKNVSTDCQSSNMAVSVYCYTNVRLMNIGIAETEDLLIGRVDIYNNTRWYGLCADIITQAIAVLTCQEFGFTDAEILLPGSFGYSSTYDAISSITCQGSESSLSECSYTIGQCSTHPYHAALACKHTTTNQGLTVLPMDGSYYGLANIKRYGLDGHVCVDGWDDVDASVLCREVGQGHHSGIAMAYRSSVGRFEPTWATRVTCDGSESKLADCTFDTNMASEWQCADTSFTAGVLCFLSSPPDVLVRLADGRSPDHGRAEVYNDVTGWGTICNSRWSNTDAAVFCRQAGYADGQTQSAAWRTQAANDVLVVLSRVTCDGTETSIFQCGNYGWLSSSPCTDHSTDAGVYCYAFVSLTPGSNYGAVQYHTGDEYGVVCADSFDAKAATVVCREMGLVVGMLLSGSAFGPLSLEFSMRDVTCVGTETSLTDCSFNEGNTCSSGQYASVICGYLFTHTYSSLNANPIITINYNSHDGLLCSDKFTHADAQVVCRQKYNSALYYGKAFKASAKLHKNSIRWLNGLNCDGIEASIDDCGTHDWGQIGSCSWDSVAAVICSTNEGDLDFDIRIVNGSQTSGRVEIKIKGTWGTMRGSDLTRQEALVMCREIGFHGGINLAPGSHGSGTGDVKLTGISCSGNEASFADCIWSGYNEDNPQQDHSKDAAVSCFYNTRLVGSTFVDYGRLEMYDSNNDMWYAVCDGNLNVNNAQIICQQMGYASGMFQKGSPLGPSSSPINIVDIDCSQSSECTFTTGSCFSEKYIALYCNDQPLTEEHLDLELPLSSFYGPVSIRRFGLWGHICSVDFDDNDALVICSELGHFFGKAVQTYGTSGHPIIQGKVKCSGEENDFKNCPRGLFAEDTGCYQLDTVAGVICYDTEVKFGSGDLDHEIGVMSTRVEVKAYGGSSMYVSMEKFTDIDAAVYCSSLGYAGGEAQQNGFGAFSISDLTCSGDEENVLLCPATWDPEKTKDLTGNLAGVRCFTAVRLLNGDPTFYGAVLSSNGVDTGLVCADNFDSTDAGAVCRSIGLDKGLVLCCAPFGTIDEPTLKTNISCPVSSSSFTQCSFDLASGRDCGRNYAAVVCYNGQKPTEYALNLERSEMYSGNVIVTYLGVNGSICMDGWDDDDAHVACKELGYPTGIAYNAARLNNAPFWTSNVHCQRNENNLSECEMTSFGDVQSCTSKDSHAGVLCYQYEGLYARLAGTEESRYGRIEIALDGQWQSVCNTHWDNEESHVVCRMLNYRTGKSYNGDIKESTTGPVWDINFQCTGEETSLTKCMSSGWRASTSVRCAGHENDAAAFCYTSVKLSTGVGRETDQGAVLLYRNGIWYTVCGDGFTQKSASVVCKELGFRDGQVQTGSKYGPLLEFPRLSTHKMTCTGDETDTYDCLTESYCDISDYASVVCYDFKVVTTEEPVTKGPEEQFNPLPIIIGVIVAICVIVLFIIIFYVWRNHKQKKAHGMPFDDFIVRQAGDGSVHISNPLQQTPERPRANYDESNNDIPALDNPGYSGFNQRGDRIEGAALPVDGGSNISSSVNEDPHLYDSIRSEPYYLTMLPVNAQVKPANS